MAREGKLNIEVDLRLVLWKARGKSLNEELDLRSWHCGRQGGSLNRFRQHWTSSFFAYAPAQSTEEPAHSKSDFNWLSGPRNGTWKRTCAIRCLRSLLAPIWRFAMQPTQTTFTVLRSPRYSAAPCCVLIQVPNAIDTMSKRWRSKKAFNTSLSRIFS